MIKKQLALKTGILLSISFLLFQCKKNQGPISKPTENIFYLGTYTGENSQGIYKYALTDKGQITALGLQAKTENPSYLAKSNDGNYLLTVNETVEGTIESYKIEKDTLIFLSRSPSGGAHPCFITINSKGDVLVANYTGGNVGLLKLNEQGKLSRLLDVQQHFGQGSTERQKEPHAHSTRFGRNEKNVISADLGTNELWFSTINPYQQKFIPDAINKLKMEEGAGPRHMAFHPKKEWLYVLNELNGTISFLDKKDDQFKLISNMSVLPKDWSGYNTSADIHISKDGQFLYASNRGHNSIAICSIQNDGTLKLIGHESTRGDSPRNFAISPDDLFLLVANQNSNNLVVFRRDVKDGLLEFVSKTKAFNPVCILF